MAVFPPVRTLIGTQFADPITITLVAGASKNATQYPLSYLMDGTSKTAWRSVDPVVAIRFDLGYAADINFVGVIGHNLSYGAKCSIHASGSAATLGVPPFVPDDEYDSVWTADQVLSRAFGVRYPNMWIDTRTATGAPTSARWWQLHVYDNTHPVTISEVVIGLATTFDGIISNTPYAASHEAQGSTAVLEYGKAYRSASGAVLRKMDLSLTLMQEQVDAFHALFPVAASVGGRMVVVPDSRYNDIWFVEWPSLRATTFPESHIIGTHRLSMVEEMFGVA